MAGWAVVNVQQWVRENPRLTALGLRWSIIGVGVAVAVWKVRHPGGSAGLQMKGLERLIAGDPEAAEDFFRKALARASGDNRVRARVCLGDALADEGRYSEAKDCLVEALQMGDPTGSGQGSMADLLLATRSDPEQAMKMAEEATRLSTQKPGPGIYFGGDAENDLKRAIGSARSAGALMLMGRKAEAQDAAARAQTLADSARSTAAATQPETPALARVAIPDRIARGRALMLSGTYWKLGRAWLAVGDTAKAAACFRITQSTDLAGKYRKLAEGELDAMAKGAASPALGWG